jgi:hypothetical protein
MTPVKRRLLRILFGVVILVGIVAIAANYLFASPPEPVLELSSEPTEATTEQVRQMCAGCHTYPPPDTFPKSAWRKEVKQGFDFFHDDPGYRFPYPSLESVVSYYENRAPKSLPYIERLSASTSPVSFAKKAGRPSAANRSPGVAFVDFVRLQDKPLPDLLVCDAVNNQVLLVPDADVSQPMIVLASGYCCVHAEVVDLDGDGIKDILLACIGSFYATDDRVGSIVLLKGSANKTFTPMTLLEGLGRVADVRAADFSGSGKKDFVIAEFGWHKTGSILIAENLTTDWTKPQFKSRVLDPRHGATHVPVIDLNGDGKPDIVAVLGQEHETVVAFINEGGGKFRTETIFKAPHPSYGVNGIALADLNKDGKIDVVLTNGDSLDPPYLLRPDHGVTLLMNEGKFPFKAQRLADAYGAGSPVVADFDGNGLPDIAFVSFLPGELFPFRSQFHLESVVLLDQYASGKFNRNALETEECDHLTCAVSDVNGDGKPDLVVGNYIRGGKSSSPLKLWINEAGKGK